MNAYQVTYELADGTTDTVSVPAVSREAAQYAAFDELIDRSIRIRRFLFTQMWHDETSRWVETNEHIRML
jgi:hypothetical protein